MKRIKLFFETLIRSIQICNFKKKDIGPDDKWPIMFYICIHNFNSDVFFHFNFLNIFSKISDSLYTNENLANLTDMNTIIKFIYELN
jgi:hypothetical protein